jgi:protein TonB
MRFGVETRPVLGAGARRYMPRSARGAGIAVVAACHVVLLAALWRVDPVRDVVAHHAPIVAQVITLPRDAAAPAPPPPVRKPVQARVARASPSVPPAPAPLSETPASTHAPPIDAAVEPALREASARAVPIVVAPAAPVVAAPVAPPAQPATPPRFDADYLRNPPPEYPAFSRRRGEEGRVLLRVHVASDGSPSEVEIRTSSGVERLDRAALDAVRRWRFVPARQGDTPVDAWVLVPIRFSLDS